MARNTWSIPTTHGRGWRREPWSGFTAHLIHNSLLRHWLHDGCELLCFHYTKSTELRNSSRPLFPSAIPLKAQRKEMWCSKFFLPRTLPDYLKEHGEVMVHFKTHLPQENSCLLNGETSLLLISACQGFKQSKATQSCYPAVISSQTVFRISLTKWGPRALPCTKPATSHLLFSVDLPDLIVFICESWQHHVL